MATQIQFAPGEAVIGGLFIGTACGVLMLTSGKVAGNSGALKSVVIGPFEASKLAYLVGLFSSGAILSRLLPSSFETPPELSPTLLLGAVATGLGTALSNGCTSGHGLCGLSRFSPRSFTAVCTFMSIAITTATATSLLRGGGGEWGIAPLVASSPQVFEMARVCGLALAAALPPLLFLTPKKGEGNLREVLVSAWVGGCFGCGLTFGGMVRPSVILTALSPPIFNPTLWVLFCTALFSTFLWYRAALSLGGVKEAGQVKGGVVDKRLVGGAGLFGVGWGLTGLCPGPLVVGWGGAVGAVGLLGVLGGVAGGFWVKKLFF